VATYLEWYALSSGDSGPANLADITDASSATDPLGTNCNASYWETHAYDQIAKIYQTLGATPGSGCKGNWTINDDNTTNDGEDSFLVFSRGVAQYGGATIQWDASEDRFIVNYDFTGTSNLGNSTYKWSKLWVRDIDVEGDVDIGGGLSVTGASEFDDVTIGGTLSVDTLTVDGNTLRVNADAETPEDVTFEAYRGDGNDSSKIMWDESDVKWKFQHTGGSWFDFIGYNQNNVVTKSMLYDGHDDVPPLYTGDSVFAGYDGLYGVSPQVARADHDHEGGTLDASGTMNTAFTLDSDYDDEDVSIELRFGNSDHYVKINPHTAVADRKFEFSHNVSPATAGTISLGFTDCRWKDLFLSGDAYIGDDLTVTGSAEFGSIAGDMNVEDDYVSIGHNEGSSTTGGIRVARAYSSGYSWANLFFDGGDWQLSNDGSTFYDIATTSSTQTLTNKTLTSPIVNTLSLNTAMKAVSGDYVYSEEPYFAIGYASPLPSDYKFIAYTGSVSTSPAIKYSSLGWQLTTNGSSYASIVTTSGSQVLTNKTISSSIISGGLYIGSPSFTGSPQFTSTTGSNANFVAWVSGVPPFSITGLYAANVTKVTYLDADKVDGVHIADILYGTGSSYTMQKDLDLNGNDLIGFSMSGYATDDHNSTHLSGGSDEIVGTLGGVLGVDSLTFRVGASTSGSTPKMYLSSATDFYVGINSASGAYKAMSIGGANVHLVPGSGSTQHLGYSTQKWGRLWLSEQVNFTPLSATVPTSDEQDGSLFVVSASPSNDFISALKIRLNSSHYRIIDQNNKTNMIGSNGNWSIAGDLVVSGTINGNLSKTVVGGTGGISAGSLVWLSGTTSGGLQIATKAIAGNTNGSTKYAMAYAPDAISEGAEGEVFVSYEKTDVDTSSVSAGAPVFLSSSSGSYSFSLPNAGYRVQVVGYVGTVHASDGKIQFILPGQIIPWSIADQIM